MRAFFLEWCKMTDMTVRILNKTFDEVALIVAYAPVDLLVHGRQDGSIVCVSGEGDITDILTRLGLESVPA